MNDMYRVSEKSRITIYFLKALSNSFDATTFIQPVFACDINSSLRCDVTSSDRFLIEGARATQSRISLINVQSADILLTIQC